MIADSLTVQRQKPMAFEIVTPLIQTASGWQHLSKTTHRFRVLMCDCVAMVVMGNRLS